MDCWRKSLKRWMSVEFVLNVWGDDLCLSLRQWDTPLIHRSLFSFCQINVSPCCTNFLYILFDYWYKNQIEIWLSQSWHSFLISLSICHLLNSTAIGHDRYEEFTLINLHLSCFSVVSITIGFLHSLFYHLNKKRTSSKGRFCEKIDHLMIFE